MSEARVNVILNYIYVMIAFFLLADSEHTA